MNLLVVIFLDFSNTKVFYGIVKNQQFAFKDLLQSRLDAINYFYDFGKDNLISSLDNATVDALGSAFGRRDGLLSLGMAQGYATVFHKLSPSVYSTLTTKRYNFTQVTDFGAQPWFGSTCSPTLIEPPALRSTNGVLCTQLRARETHYYNSHMAFMTRAYENTVPGPVWRIRAGDRVQVQLRNEMQDRCSLSQSPTCWSTCQTADNREACPTTTNLHTHGLHIDGIGIGDNVLRKVNPGGSLPVP